MRWVGVFVKNAATGRLPRIAFMGGSGEPAQSVDQCGVLLWVIEGREIF